LLAAENGKASAGAEGGALALGGSSAGAGSNGAAAVAGPAGVSTKAQGGGGAVVSEAGRSVASGATAGTVVSPVRVRLKVNKPRSPTKSTSPDGAAALHAHGQHIALSADAAADEGQQLTHSDAIEPKDATQEGQQLSRSDAMSPGGTSVVVIKKKRRPKSPNKALKKMFKVVERRDTDGQLVIDPLSPTRSPMSPDNFGLTSPTSPSSPGTFATSPTRSPDGSSPTKTWL
jgi:hypothetical protein